VFQNKNKFFQFLTRIIFKNSSFFKYPSKTKKNHTFISIQKKPAQTKQNQQFNLLKRNKKKRLMFFKIAFKKPKQDITYKRPQDSTGWKNRGIRIHL